jgi:hypothetical protein
MSARPLDTAAPRRFPAALLFFPILSAVLLASCASDDLPGLAAMAAAVAPSDSAADPGFLTAVPEHVPELMGMGYSLVQIDGTRLSPALLSQLLGIGRLPAAAGRNLVRQAVALFGPVAPAGNGEVIAFVSAGVTSQVVGRRLEEAGYRYAPRDVGGYRRPRWEMNHPEGPNLVVELVEAGLYRFSRDATDLSADAALAVLRRAREASTAGSGYAAGDAAPLALGISSGAASPFVNFFGNDLAGIRDIGFALYSGPAAGAAPGANGSDPGLRADVTIRASTTLQARALRSLLRIVLLQFAREMFPGGEPAALRDSIDLSSDGSVLLLRNYPLDPGWFAERLRRDP